MAPHLEACRANKEAMLCVKGGPKMKREIGSISHQGPLKLGLFLETRNHPLIDFTNYSFWGLFFALVQTPPDRFCYSRMIKKNISRSCPVSIYLDVKKLRIIFSYFTF